MTDVWCFVVHEGRVWGRTHKDLEWGLFELGVDDNDYLISGYQNIFIKCDFDTLVVYMGEEMHTVARKVVRLHIKHSGKQVYHAINEACTVPEVPKIDMQVFLRRNCNHFFNNSLLIYFRYFQVR